MAISTPPGFESFHQSALLPGEDELPCSDGESTFPEKHRRQSHVLVESLELALTGHEDVFVGSNMFCFFRKLKIKKDDLSGPDVFVLFDTNRPKRKSWLLAPENYRTPDVVIELVSESTEDVDRGEKMRIYAKLLHVANYYIFDPESLQLDGYSLDPQRGEYVPLQPNAHGNLVCPPLGLQLGVRHGCVLGIEDDWLRWIDAQGNVLPTPEDQARAAQDQARAAQDQARAAQDQARAAQDQARAAQDQARAAQDQAIHEAHRRADAERRLADALAELERLKAAH